jgi:hypothetical protein
MEVYGAPIRNTNTHRENIRTYEKEGNRKRGKYYAIRNKSVLSNNYYYYGDQKWRKR